MNFTISYFSISGGTEKNVTLFTINVGGTLMVYTCIFNQKDFKILTVSKPYFENKGGIILLSNCTFSNVIFESSSLIYYSDVQTPDTEIVIQNCIFENIHGEGDNPCVLETGPVQKNYVVLIQDFTKFRFSDAFLSTKGGLIYFYGDVNSKLIIQDTEFTTVGCGNNGDGGAVNLNGSINTLVVNRSLFVGVSSGRFGGAMYINLNDVVNPESIISDDQFKNCEATSGGSIYINNKGIKLNVIQFLENYGEEYGSDIFYGKSDNFYDESTVVDVCSTSDKPRFLLSDSSNKDSLISDCMLGDIFVSVSGYDINDCKSELTACRSINGAIQKFLDGGYTPYVTVVGIYNDASTTLETEFLYLHGRFETFLVKEGDSISMGNNFYSSSFFVVITSHLYLSYLIIYHDGNSWGPFVCVKNPLGKCVIRDCIITSNTFRNFECQYSFIVINDGSVEIYQTHFEQLEYGSESLISVLFEEPQDKEELLTTPSNSISILIEKTKFSNIISQSTLGMVCNLQFKNVFTRFL
jgi:hypothetical protein